MRRNQGARYASDTTGRNIPGREVGPHCKCKKNKCWSLLQGGELHIFNNLWNLGDFNIQNAYQFFCVLRQQGLNGYTRRKDKNLILVGEVAPCHIM
jgi:hypothetical protein